MRHGKILLGLVVLLLCSQAYAGWGLRTGSYTQNNAAFVGLEYKLNLLLVGVNPNVEYVFVDGGQMATFNLDGMLQVGLLPLVSVWGGAGFGWLYSNPDNASTSTENIFQLLAGVGLNIPLKPYVQFKYITSKVNDGFVLGLGVRF